MPSQFELDRGLQRGAGIEAGADALRQRVGVAQRRGISGRAIAPYEFSAVSGPARLLSGEIGKGHAGPVIDIPRIAREDRAGLGVALGHDRRRRCAAGKAEHPFDIGCDRQAPRPAGDVAQGQLRDLDRIVQRHVLQKLEHDTVSLDLETAVPPPVTHEVARAFMADRQRCRSPDIAGFEIAHIENLAGAVADRIVGPGGELVVAAVLRPGVAAALCRDLEAE